MTPRAAHRLFDRERARFARLFPQVRAARLVLLDRPCTSPQHCRWRDLAYATFEPPTVHLLRRALDLPVVNVRGLVRHELGHLADEEIDRPGREQRADDLAEQATGQVIAYDEHDVQTTGRGRYPRPRHLHR